METGEGKEVCPPLSPKEAMVLADFVTKCDPHYIAKPREFLGLWAVELIAREGEETISFTSLMEYSAALKGRVDYKTAAQLNDQLLSYLQHYFPQRYQNRRGM